MFKYCNSPIPCHLGWHENKIYYRMGRRISAIWLVNYCVRIFHWLARDIAIAIAIAKTISTILRLFTPSSQMRTLVSALYLIKLDASSTFLFQIERLAELHTCKFGNICDCESVEWILPWRGAPALPHCTAGRLQWAAVRWARRALQGQYM